MFRTAQRLPVDEKRDRVLGLRDAVVGCGGRDAGGGARGDARGDREVLQDPAADVDVVGGEVVAGGGLAKVVEGEWVRG